MKRNLFLSLFGTAALLLLGCSDPTSEPAGGPWSHGALCVSADGRFLQHTDGTPFFWLGNTAWLLPEKSTREEAGLFLDATAAAGYNVIPVQVVNGVPATNAYGASSMPDGFDFSRIAGEGPDGYWRHMDYIVRAAADRGLYVGMVCIWGGLVKAGLMNEEQAAAYGAFLADRYREAPNIVWIIGGDIRGDVQTAVWERLARTIKSRDPNHLMTFHPFGRTSSAQWFHNAEWLDFHLFQSGHRRYDQLRSADDSPEAAALNEDNWRYVEAGRALEPAKPILDGEPVYEDIPHGLHDPAEPRWTAADVRRYAYWSVFAGACGHTYGHNAIMQFHAGNGETGAYDARKSWREALHDEGFLQMHHLADLIGRFPYFERVPDQSLLDEEEGFRYDRAVATRGRDYLLVYNYTNRPMTVNLDRIEGAVKRIVWFDPRTGTWEEGGESAGGSCLFRHDSPEGPGNDRVLVAFDARKAYFPPAAE